MITKALIISAFASVIIFRSFFADMPVDEFD